MTEYYIAQAGSTEPIGPMTLEQIRMGVDQGAISPYYLYCTRGASEWRPLTELLNQAPPIPSSPMGTTQAPVQMAPGMAKPSNYLILAIFTTLCCCLPLGIIAIIKASSVDSLWHHGRYQEARKAADAAASYCTGGIIIGIAYNIIIYTANFSILDRFPY